MPLESMAGTSHHPHIHTSPGHQQVPPRPGPVSASALASIEKQRRDFVRGLGPCRSGCDDLDNYVLLSGGFERGSVVGISAEDEDGVGVTVGFLIYYYGHSRVFLLLCFPALFLVKTISNITLSQLGLQVLACSLLDKAAQKAQVITPKPPSTIVVLLKNAITAELKARNVSAADEIATRRRDCLDRIMLSRVFDMDGLDEVLADLDATTAASGGGEMQSAKETTTVTAAQPDSTAAAGGGDGDDAAVVTSMEEKEQQEASVVAEIQDSQDEDETPSPPPSPVTISQPPRLQSHDISNMKDAATEPDTHNAAKTQINKNDTTATPPDVLLITHFSSLLTSFFTQRDKPAAHAALRLLATRLRRLSRTLPSNPLVILINSTDSGAHASESHSHENPNLSSNSALRLPEQQSAAASSSSSSTAYKSASSTDPTLRSIFNPAQASASYKANKPTFGLVFTQLLDLHLLCTRAPRSNGAAPYSIRAMTVVEVLLDEIGLWEGVRGQRKRREQRWTIVVSHNGRILSISGGEGKRETES
ncbi:hypothetical protein ACSS6W_010626 [Trichoderma asperelloides]